MMDCTWTLPGMRATWQPAPFLPGDQTPWRVSFSWSPVLLAWGGVWRGEAHPCAHVLGPPASPCPPRPRRGCGDSVLGWHRGPRLVATKAVGNVGGMAGVPQGVAQVPRRLLRGLRVQRRGAQGRLGFSRHLQCRSPDGARRGGVWGEDATHIPPSRSLLLLLALPGEKPSHKSRVVASPGSCLLSKHCFLGVRGASAI